jgi:predicted SnoaL-like aldol condensation-catalyzing enzyme
MKNPTWPLLAIIILTATSCKEQAEDINKNLETNKKVSTMFHDRNLEEIDELISDNFIASYYHTDPQLHTWDKDDHRNAIISRPSIKDSIILQIAEGNWVATRLVRTSIESEGLKKAELLQIKKIQDGKIIELFEIFSPPQLTKMIGAEETESE